MHQEKRYKVRVRQVREEFAVVHVMADSLETAIGLGEDHACESGTEWVPGPECPVEAVAVEEAIEQP